MRKVYTADSLVQVAHLRNVLETAGIPCTVRNDRLGGAIGEIPFVECWPELWVTRPADLLRARELVEEALRETDSHGTWTCPGCGETIEAQFGVCWHCAEPRGDA